MTRDIVALIKREGLGSVSDLIGRRASEWAARDLDA
jgi:hypothetical protein